MRIQGLFFCFAFIVKELEKHHRNSFSHAAVFAIVVRIYQLCGHNLSGHLSQKKEEPFTRRCCVTKYCIFRRTVCVYTYFRVLLFHACCSYSCMCEWLALIHVCVGGKFLKKKKIMWKIWLGSFSLTYARVRVASAARVHKVKMKILKKSTSTFFFWQ